jgi:lysozyme
MKISDEGIRLIKSFEGYHTRLKDGSCAAYLCPANVPTIGYGCTEGVRLGMVWTEAEALAGLAKEIAKFEETVSRVVTVPINQNEYDAMVSLAYNIGSSAFSRSTVLKRLNKGDRAGAAKAFEMWVRGGGRVLPGLVSRRKREAALFLKPVEAPEVPAMPQSVEEKKAPLPAPVVIGGAVSTGLALPSLPTPPVDQISNVAAWQSSAETVSGFIGSPVMKYALCGMILYWMICHLGPRLLNKMGVET